MARDIPLKLSRRQFVAASSAALVGLSFKSGNKPVAGGFVNESHELGHRLRDRNSLPTARRDEKASVVIVGGGMAGLSAAWWLEKRGFRDFVLLELEQQAGGNSRWGENEVSAYPWAAHYVPLPNKNADLVRELFEEMGVLDAKTGEWDERHLCHSPQERLFIGGRWQEGIEPHVGLSANDREQFKRFHERIKELQATGCFTVPMQPGIEKSLRSPATAALDRLCMTEWMSNEKFDSAHLHWYVDYGCRDDYGASARDTSAWAGIHYFASRENDDKGPLTWPEGNGWIAKRLVTKLEKHIRRGAMVHRVARDKNRWQVFAGETRYLADAVIFAAPTFLAPYLVESFPRSSTTDFTYSPWLTANLTLDRWPAASRHSEYAWDNVLYNSPSLGYVVANHQSLASVREKSVWTYYWALTARSARDERTNLLAKDWNHWKELILNDLAKAHPDIRDCVSRIDIMRMGHAMVRPTPGFVLGKNREQMASAGRNRLYFANSDVSGISIFEEAQYRGVAAAQKALRAAGRA